MPIIFLHIWHCVVVRNNNFEITHQLTENVNLQQFQSKWEIKVMKQQVKIIPYGELKRMGKIPLKIPKDKITSSSDEYRNLFHYHKDDAPVAYFDGDLHIEGSLKLDKLFNDLFLGHEKLYDFPDKGYAYTDIAAVWIAGDLTVSNTIIANELENLSKILVVEKNVTTKNIIQGGFDFFFLGDLVVNQILYTQLGAEGCEIVFGEENIYIHVDINFYWKIGNNKSIEIDEETPLETLQKIFINTSTYFDHELIDRDDHGDECYYYLEEKFIQDVLNGKNIFNENIVLNNTN